MTVRNQVWVPLSHHVGCVAYSIPNAGIIAAVHTSQGQAILRSLPAR